jgi:transcriptional regulator with XRE-family HTH domain
VTPLRLQEVRKKARLSQSELSKLSGVNVRTIQEYEYGRKIVDSAKLNIITALAEALQVPLYELLEDKELADKVKANTKREV